MSLKISVKMKAEYMYDFMLYHNYTHLNGLFSVVAGVIFLGVFLRDVAGGLSQSSWVWLMCAVLLLFISPYTIWTRAKSQVENTEMFQNPLEYEFAETGIVVRQGDAEATTEWNEISKAVSTQKSVILYVGRVRALIFPKKCMEGQYEEVLKMIHTHVQPKKVKIRHIH